MKRRIPRPVLAVAATLFAAATLLYGGLWMVAVRVPAAMPSVELGYDADYLPREQAQFIRNVQKNSPAEAAGLRPGDLLLAIDGQPQSDPSFQVRTWLRHQPGDTVRLTLRHADGSPPVITTGVFRQRITMSKELPLRESLANQFRTLYPVPFVLVGLAILFLRVDDARVWVLALLFGAFSTIPGQQDTMTALAPRLEPVTAAYRALAMGLLGPLFFWFASVFPSRSPADKRHPWWKWSAAGLGVWIALPGLRTGNAALPAAFVRVAGQDVQRGIVSGFTYAYIALGLVTLIRTYTRSADSEARRKIRVMFFGTVAGVWPVAAIQAAKDFAGLRSSLWLDTAEVALLFLFPLSFAYAVLKHRVLEIPVLLRRSARYLLVQRGFTILLALVSIGLTLLFALEAARRPLARLGQSAAITLGAVFGTALLWSGSRVHRRVSGRIDRAFFRSSYDARRILEDLTEKTRAATGRAELARLLQCHIGEALQPAWIAVYLRETNDTLVPAAGDPQAPSVPASSPWIDELARRARPWECPDTSAFRPLWPEYLAPMSGRGGLLGLLALGPRLSEEPYSREDLRLLSAVAAQSATALENIRLAEEIAERLEAERRAAREMEIAREVQGRLLPQAAPDLRTLECAARCIQARSVGGDYYDFLRLDAGRLGLVLADVSGKGVHAALLMANLQAHLRSQTAGAAADPVAVLRQVNRMLYDSTGAQHYATLFFGIYDDRTRRLTYVNCGHNPPILLSPDGSVRRLEATATVVGMFERLDCEAREVCFAPGDLLAIFSDGVTEAMRGEEEFGEARLLECLHATRSMPAVQIVSTILAGVQAFSAGTQSDDLTLVIAKS
jgi:sigma-B regulation protein RsbU (phosphoserine phosphatase)